MTPDYSYQEQMVATAISHMETAGKALLAGSVGAGKTEMAIQIIEWYLTNHTDDVLILTEGQTDLRSQFAGEIKGRFPFKEITVFDKTIGSDRVHICIPHAFVAKDYSFPRKIGLVVADEAHHFYLVKDGMVQKIIKNNKPRFQLLLTGTPSRFIYQNKLADKIVYPIVGISILELLKRNVIQDVTTIIAQTEHYNFGLDAYRPTMELTQEFDFEGTNRVLDGLLVQIHARLVSMSRTKPEHRHWLKDLLPNWTSVLTTIDKTLFSCHNQNQARDTFKYFQKLGINCALSISDYDDGDQINKFRNDDACKVLIVVRRAILGFNYPSLVNHVDLSASLNPDVILQKIGRVIRRHPERLPKLFIKVCPTKIAWATYAIMSLTLALVNSEYYLTFDGRIKNFKFPIARKAKKAIAKKAELITQPKTGDNSIIEELPDLLTFLDLDHVDNDVYQEYAYTTFNTVRHLLDPTIETPPEIIERINKWRRARGKNDLVLPHA